MKNMIFTFRKNSPGGTILGFVMALVVLLLAACGGGGGSPGTNESTTGTSTSPTISIQLLDSTGASTNVITTSGPITAKATLLSATGAPIANTAVTFSTSQSSFTTFSPSSASVLTDANGVAEVTLTIASLSIAQTQAGSGDVLTANASVGTAVATGTIPFSIGSTNVTLNLVAPATNPFSLNAYASTQIKVNVLAQGALYTAAPVVVNFSSPCVANGKATMQSSATTVQGQAQVTYTDLGCSSTDNVTISVAGAPSITETLNVAAPVAASIQFVGSVPSDETIVIKGSGGNGRVETAALTFKVLDTFGNPLPNESVAFSVNSTNPVTLEATSGVTNSAGEVVVTVSSGSMPTTFRVIATLPSGQTTLSDTISVTTGQPIQAAFSLSVGTWNIEGWSHDNVQTNVNILLADANGNPVADGTPVVFQTDSGAIGSSTNGGCVTTNGGCTVTFRSQNPRYDLNNTVGKRGGLATISVSTTSSAITLSGQTSIFLSGSSPDNAILTFGSTALTKATNGSYSIALTNCSTTVFDVQLNDVNFNPMPFGTTINATATTANTIQTAVIGTIFPTSVPDIGTSLPAAANRVALGDTHVIQFTPGPGPGATACGSGASPGGGEIDVTVTSPLGTVTVIPVLITYPK